MITEVNTPLTPLTATGGSQSLPSSAPMVTRNGVTYGEPSSSTADPRREKNLSLASRIEGYSSGGLPADIFLNTYLPGPCDELSKEALGNSLASILVQTKNSIYETFVSFPMNSQSPQLTWRIASD